MLNGAYSAKRAINGVVYGSDGHALETSIYHMPATSKGGIELACAWSSSMWLKYLCITMVMYKLHVMTQRGAGSRVKEFSVPRIEHPLGDSSKKGSHVYFLLQVFEVILLFWYKCCCDSTMVIWCQSSTIWSYNSSIMATIIRK